MRKILIELQIDWEGYEDVSDELIVEDAIEAKVEGVGWTLLRQPLVIGSVCDGCGSKFDAMDISVGVCYCCQKEIKQTDL